MLIDTPKSDIWARHVSYRWTEAVDLGLLARNLKTNTGGKVFVPDVLDVTSLPTIDPAATSLRSIEGKKLNVATNTWVRRLDLFDEAAAWLSRRAEIGSVLLCEAGYSKPGDASLQDRPHVLHGDRVFLKHDFSASTQEQLISILRWGRSWRVLGVATTLAENRVFEGAHDGVFLCDAFDGDSLIVAEIVNH